MNTKIASGPGGSLRELREQAGLTVAQVASGVGIRDETIRKWETGQAESSPFLLAKLSGFIAGHILAAVPKQAHPHDLGAHHAPHD